MASQLRVSIVVRPLDRVLSGLRLAMVPVLVVAVSLPALRGLGPSYAVASPWLLSVVALPIAAVYMLLLQTEAIGRRVDRVVASVQRQIAVACHEGEAATLSLRRIACFLTPPDLRAPLFRYDQQRQTVNRLLSACRSEDGDQFWFVEGESGSGKTRAALLLVQALVRSHDLFELAGRCYLYDLAQSDAVQTQLHRRLATPRHADALVLVDNFHLVTASVLRDITNRLIDRPGRVPERMIIFLSQPGHAWNLSPGSDVRLVSEAKVRNHHLMLAGPSAESISQAVAEYDPPTSQIVRDLQDTPIASAAQLHLAQVIARNRLVPPEVQATLRLLRGDIGPPPSPDFLRLLATVSVLSLHRGGFSRHEFSQAVRTSAREHTRLLRIREAIRMRRALRRLRQVGLVPRVQVSGPRYVFHEAMAELFADRLNSIPGFHIPFIAAGHTLVGRLLAQEDWSRAWLIAAELGDDAVMEATFDQALSTGMYWQMARCLKRTATTYEQTMAVKLQRAILLDRIGDFKGSRAEFTEDLVSAFESTGDLAVILASSRVEAAHEGQSVAALEALSSHPDRLVQLVAMYWGLHIAAHQGHFEPDQLLRLGVEALELVNARRSHWYVTALARMHFDSLRHLYLAGTATTAELTSAERRMIDDFLRPRLPTYEALQTLYRKAHFVAHVLVPQLAIFNIPISPEQAALAELDAEAQLSVRGLIAAAQSLYRRAKDEFWQYGDREALYLQADLLNIDMVQDGSDLDALAVRLHVYGRFIKEASFRTIASYPDFYFLRWHMLKYYACLLHDGTVNVVAADEHYHEAHRRLHRMRDLDADVGNEYGLLRCDVLEVLLASSKAPLVQEELRELRARARTAGYRFEEALTAHLAERPGLTSAELRTVLRFYPFVHQ